MNVINTSTVPFRWHSILSMHITVQLCFNLKNNLVPLCVGGFGLSFMRIPNPLILLADSAVSPSLVKYH